jgi:hypothetical protein
MARWGRAGAGAVGAAYQARRRGGGRPKLLGRPAAGGAEMWGLPPLGQARDGDGHDGEKVTRSGGERNERIRLEESGSGRGFHETNTVRHVSVFKAVCSYHGVYSFVFVGYIRTLRSAS